MTNLKDEFGTPWAIFSPLHELFKFELDVCASDKNFKLLSYYTIKDDGLKKPWSISNWCNPPYSNPLPWVEKAIDHIGTTVMLLKGDFSTRFYRKIWKADVMIWHINHRIKYEGASQSAEFCSMIVVFNPVLAPKEIVSLVSFKSGELEFL